MKLLLVEDQSELAANIKDYFSKEGDICEVALTLAKAQEKLYGFDYDVLLLDLMLPDGDGFSLLQTIKDKWPDLGVLTVAAHLPVMPLRGQMRSHGRMAPRESVLAVADHLEGLVPLRVARHISVQAHQ